VRLTLLIHILAGALGLAFGYVALYSTKGATLHRSSGMLFVYAMVTMCFGGFALAVATSNNWTPVNASAAVMTCYLIITSLMTVRPAGASSRWLAVGAMLVALLVGATDLVFGFEALAGGGRRNGVRIMLLLAVPVLAVLVTMVYWLWRVQHKRPSRGLVGVSAQQAI
jgi:uncharacterized membrane protein